MARSKAQDAFQFANHVGHEIYKAQGLFAGAHALAYEAQHLDPKDTLAQQEALAQIQYCIEAGNAQLDELVDSFEGNAASVRQEAQHRRRKSPA